MTFIRPRVALPMPTPAQVLLGATEPPAETLAAQKVEKLEARTPGIRRALKKLAERKRANRARVKRGEKPILQDPQTKENKRVSLKTYYARTGVKKITPTKKGKAQASAVKEIHGYGTPEGVKKSWEKRERAMLRTYKSRRSPATRRAQMARGRFTEEREAKADWLRNMRNYRNDVPDYRDVRRSQFGHLRPSVEKERLAKYMARRMEDKTVKISRITQKAFDRYKTLKTPTAKARYKRLGKLRDEAHFQRAQNPFKASATPTVMQSQGRNPLQAYGTSEGVKKSWNTRGRGRHKKEERSLRSRVNRYYQGLTPQQQSNFMRGEYGGLVTVDYEVNPMSKGGPGNLRQESLRKSARKGIAQQIRSWRENRSPIMRLGRKGMTKLATHRVKGEMNLPKRFRIAKTKRAKAFSEYWD